MKPLFRAGDVVRHRPSGETWTLAYGGDIHRGGVEHVSACGWPESVALATDCELVTAATDLEHRTALMEVSRSYDDHRGGVCRRQLAALNEDEAARAP